MVLWCYEAFTDAILVKICIYIHYQQYDIWIWDYTGECENVVSTKNKWRFNRLTDTTGYILVIYIYIFAQMSYGLCLKPVDLQFIYGKSDKKS